MEQQETASLEVETQLLPGQVFYILYGNIADVTFLIGTGNLKAIDALRSEAVRSFITDAQGKAEIKDLKPGIHYICGVGKTDTGIWSVRIDLKPGQNSLVLDKTGIPIRNR
jgi:hypothetical protein